MTAPNRVCRRKHWRVWRLKVLDGRTQLVHCPLCGSEAVTKVPGSPEHQAEIDETQPETGAPT